MFMNGRDILDGSDIVAVRALDCGIGTDVGEPSFHSSHGRLWLGGGEVSIFFQCTRYTIPIPSRKKQVI